MEMRDPYSSYKYEYIHKKIKSVMYIITGHKSKRNQVEIQRKLLLKK